MTGPVEAMSMTFADRTGQPISAGWRYAVAKPIAGSAPRVRWKDINCAETLFNTMIAPLGRTLIAGIVGYQGESDTGLPCYDRRLSAMIADWR